MIGLGGPTLDVQGVGAPGPSENLGGEMKKMDHGGMKMESSPGRPQAPSFACLSCAAR
jgi:hypothetical protein